MQIIKRLWGNNPMKENQIESLETVDSNKRYIQIMEVMGDKELNFREIAEEMYKKGYTPTPELLYSQPRVTEMVQKGMLEPTGKVRSNVSGKMVTVFKVRDNGSI